MFILCCFFDGNLIADDIEAQEALKKGYIYIKYFEFLFVFEGEDIELGDVWEKANDTKLYADCLKGTNKVIPKDGTLLKVDSIKERFSD